MNAPRPSDHWREGRLVDSPSGGRLFVAETGDGPPLLLLHGVGLWSDDWLGAAEHLRHAFRVIRMDSRGQGRSSAPGGPWRLDDFTDDVASVLDALRIDNAHLAGFSMGGLISQAFAIRFPHRVNRLALLAATTGRSAEEQRQIEGRLAFIRAEHPGTYFLTHAAPRWFTEAFRERSAEIVEGCRTVVAANDHAAYVKAYEVLVANDLADRLHQIRAKTLVLTAENDIGAGPNVARLIAARIRQSELLILPDYRHHILLEAPEAVGRALRKFFDGTVGAEPAGANRPR